MRAKLLTRFHKFPFFIVSLKDIGKLRSPSRQLFMLNLFVFHKERPFRPLNGLNWPFEFPNFLSKRAIISAVMQKNYDYHKSFFPQNFMFYKIYLVHFAQIAKKNLNSTFIGFQDPYFLDRSSDPDLSEKKDLRSDQDPCFLADLRSNPRCFSRSFLQNFNCKKSSISNRLARVTMSKTFSL